MSLATRCIHCGTIFKIVEDQLKVSEGWVRCGRCNEVFNALPTLFDMDSEAPPPRRTPAPPPQQTPVMEAFTFTPPAPVRSPPAPDPQIEDELPPEPARPVRGTTDFELDTSVPAQEMSWTRRHAAPPASSPLAAPPRPIPSPLAPPPMPEAELPSTDEADALDSRYLMPSDRERPAPRRRT
nr:zinc-ribbon domain-containing protein [Aquabacterium sp.]